MIIVDLVTWLSCDCHMTWLLTQRSWDSVASIISYYSAQQDDFQPYAGPGHWNDPGMVWHACCNINWYLPSLIPSHSINLASFPVIMSTSITQLRFQFLWWNHCTCLCTDTAVSASTVSISRLLLVMIGWLKTRRRLRWQCGPCLLR